jgi:glucokinase
MVVDSKGLRSLKMSKDDPRLAVLGVDFGATNLKALIVNENGRKIEECLEPSEPERGPENTLGRIIDLINRARQKALSANYRIIRVGMGVCGPVDPSTGELVESPVLPGWKHVPVARTVEAAIGIPFYIDNDANVAILGEWWQGCGKRTPVVAGLTIGTGVGGGLVINGQIYRGAMGFGGEFGHIQVAKEPPCPCGGRGCLGRVASATATIARYLELSGAKASPVNGMQDVGRLAEAGDGAAIEAIAVSANYLAKAALCLVNFLNPNVLVFTGGMALLGKMLLDPIRDTIRTSTFKMVRENTQIACGSLDIYSGCFGAAWLALSKAKALP